VAWTEHVSRAGVASIAPAAPTAPAEPAALLEPVAPAAIELPAVAPAAAAVEPDWFPDPSGRHQWRFWGGDGWTPHVSDDGVHLDDPLTSPAPPPDPDQPVG
jgi:hypothetical protein